MNTLKLFTTITLLFGCILLMNSCKDSSKSEPSQEQESSKEQGKEYTSAYICPMHCEGSGSDSEGKCPVCGMDYVMNDKVQNDSSEENEHDHEHGEDGHNHKH